MAPIVRTTLESASALCSDAQGEKVDLVARVLAREPSDLTTFVHDIGTVVAHADRADPDPRRDLRHPRAPGAALVRPQHRRAVGAGPRRRLHDGAASARTSFPGNGLRRADGRHHDGNPLGARGDASDRGRRASVCVDQPPRSWADRALDVSLAVPGASSGPARHARACSSRRCTSISPRA